MRYRVITNEDTSDLSIRVEEHLKDGWELQGGVSLAYNRGYARYCQAVVKNS